MKTLLLLASCYLLYSTTSAQNVGIGTATPNATAQLHIDVGLSTTKGFLVTSSSTTGTVPDYGAGARMMFYPGKSAFRAGYVNGTQWDNANVGYYSTATGSNTIARGPLSTAMGSNTTAIGFISTAMGNHTYASGDYSTAMGHYTTSSGTFSTAMGNYASTNYQLGSFVIGDSDPNNQGLVMPGQSDLFVARFYNGYYLYTSGVTSNFGVAINHNGNAWVSVCDKNRKENFEQLDGEDVLQKISNINFTSWNYKQQDAKIYRHYGIMAQDFYKAFGHDKYGTIGNDTTVNPIDMIGIDMAAIKALEKRTERLTAENIELKERLDKLEKLIKNK